MGIDPGRTWRDTSGLGGPIHMGIDPRPSGVQDNQPWWPHTHGDRPNMLYLHYIGIRVAPYTWGETRDLLIILIEQLGGPIHMGIEQGLVLTEGAGARW